MNERGLIVNKPQGINTANIVGNPQADAQQHFQTPPGFGQMNAQQQQPGLQVPKPYGYQYGGFGTQPQTQGQAQAAQAHHEQAHGLAQGFNQFGTQSQGLFDDAQGQRPAVRMPSVSKTPGKTNTGTSTGVTATPSASAGASARKASASKATNKPVERAKGTMINGLFYPEGQSAAEEAAAAKKKAPFVAKGMFVASANPISTPHLSSPAFEHHLLSSSQKSQTAHTSPSVV